MCDRLAAIYECFAYANSLYSSIRSESGHFCIFLFLLDKNIHFGLLKIIIPNACVSGDDDLNDFRISFLYQFWNIVYVS